MSLRSNANMKSNAGGTERLTVAVTGASRGIGRETALQLAAKSHSLLLGARDTEALKRLEEEIRLCFPESDVAFFRMDVACEEDVEAFARFGAERFGAIDALVNSAGFGVFADALELSYEDFSRMVDVNLKGTFLCCKAFARVMKSRGSGKIINLASVAGTTALPGCAGYSASKFGVMGLTKVFQAELRRHGIMVTAVVPGSVRSSFWDGMSATPELADMIPVEVMAAQLVHLLELPGGAFVDEIAIMPPKGIL